MQADSKIAIVTGANKGIGWWIVEGITKFNTVSKIILCARDQSRGETAISELLEKYPSFDKNRIDLGILDINSKESIDSFKTWFGQKYQKVDYIVNNAGFAYKGSTFNRQVLEETFLTNYDGTSLFQETMSPLMNANGKVIYVASGAGPMTLNRCSEDKQKRFMDSNINKDILAELKAEMLNDLDNGEEEYKKRGWPTWGYGLSKLYLITYVKWQAKLPEYVDRGIQVYSMCPGWCRTDMAGDKAIKTAKQGAETVLMLLEKPAGIVDSEQGGFFSENKQRSFEPSSTL